MTHFKPRNIEALQVPAAELMEMLDQLDMVRRGVWQTYRVMHHNATGRDPNFPDDKASKVETPMVFSKQGLQQTEQEHETIVKVLRKMNLWLPRCTECKGAGLLETGPTDGLCPVCRGKCRLPAQINAAQNYHRGMPDRVFVHCSMPDMRGVVERACKVWSSVMHGYVEFYPTMSPGAQVWIRGDRIDKHIYPGCSSLCERSGGSSWVVTMDSTVEWDITSWQRFRGKGKNALTCIMHELGHVLQLPHSDNPCFVMYEDAGGNGRLGAFEQTVYRDHFVRHVAQS